MKYLVSLIFIFFIFIGCNRNNQISIKTIELPQNGNEIVNSNNTFGINAFSKIIASSSDDENIMISPFGLNIALLMTLNGANGTTAEEMKNVLQINDLSINEINQCYKDLLKNLISNDKKVKLTFANSIWIDNSISANPDFLTNLTDYYDAQAENVDFANPSTVDDINSWVKKHTNRKIDKIIDNLQSDEVMALLNAIYFEGEWHYDFKENETSLRDFYLPDSSVIQVETMTQTKTLKRSNSEIYTAVELPYGQGNFVMDVFMPNYGYNFNDLLDTLSNFENIVNDFYQNEVTIFLPKFEYNYKINLNDILIQLGMPSAFSSDADFSNMSDLELAISRVLQKTYIKVNEKGTEAAAVTFVGIKELSAGELLSIDRPFLYIIREVSTNTIIFEGIVNNPSKN